MPSDLIRTGISLLATTPGAWEQAMRPLADLRVQSVIGREFSAEVRLFKLPRTTLFSLKLPSARVVVPEGSGFISVNIVSRGEIRTASPGRSSVWEAGTAHVLNHDDDRFDFTSDENLDSLALCFHEPLLRDYARKFHGRDGNWFAQDATGLRLDSDAGRCFTRYVKFIWGELNVGGAFLRSPLATEEIEDSLWALLLSAVQGDRGVNDDQRTGSYSSSIKQAEEYILGNLDEPLRVTDIASAVGVSVPTLNRAFRKSHGMGPKAFVKRRRLDRVRSSLLNADPQSTTVTAVATSFGFFHLSHFAAEYKRTFHEAPSDTLRRR